MYPARPKENRGHRGLDPAPGGEQVRKRIKGKNRNRPKFKVGSSRKNPVSRVDSFEPGFLFR